jgi:hypothetical protein
MTMKRYYRKVKFKNSFDHIEAKEWTIARFYDGKIYVPGWEVAVSEEEVLELGEIVSAFARHPTARDEEGNFTKKYL